MRARFSTLRSFVPWSSPRAVLSLRQVIAFMCGPLRQCFSACGSCRFEKQECAVLQAGMEGTPFTAMAAPNILAAPSSEEGSGSLCC